MQQPTRLETNLANVMIAELAGPQRQIAANDSDHHFPLIEILREVAFGPDDAGVTSKFYKGAIVDADDTVPHALYSSPYERVELGAELAPTRRPRHRPATISRTALARRFSAPYERIEIVELAEPRPKSLASGTFEVAWFATPDDALVANDEEALSTSAWIWIVAGALAVALVVLLLVV